MSTAHNQNTTGKYKSHSDSSQWSRGRKEKQSEHQEEDIAEACGQSDCDLRLINRFAMNLSDAASGICRANAKHFRYGAH